MTYLTKTTFLGLTLASAAIGCGGDDAPPKDGRNPLYVAAETALQQGCFANNANCHGQGGSLAMLDIGAAIAAGDFRSAVVNVPACEYDVMDIVEPGDPDASWLMVKITAPFVGMDEADPPNTFVGDLVFTPDPSWSEADKCNANIRGFGQRMPQTSPFQAPESIVNALRAWIEAGAPGPNDPMTSDAGT